jgi:hypothetical protein
MAPVTSGGIPVCKAIDMLELGQSYKVIKEAPSYLQII